MNWKINLSSSANKSSLSENQLSKIFNCFKNEEYQKFRNKSIEKDKQYNKYPAAKWQLQKSKEIEELFHNNIKYIIDNDLVNVDISFEIDFPDDWNKDNVIDWIEGFDRLNRVFLMIQMDELILNKNIKDYNIDRKENDFLEELTKNQKFNFQKN